MNNATTEEVLKEPVELPQIRFPVKGAKNAEDVAGEKDDIAKLNKIVAEAFGAIEEATGLSEKEVLRVIKDTDVEMLKDVMKDDINVEALKEGVQESIKKISLATALETAQISEIFTAKQDADLDDIVNRLQHRAQTNRDTFGN